jgi:hypothetical protein
MEKPEEKLFLLAFEEDHCAHWENSTTENDVAPNVLYKIFFCSKIKIIS